MQKGSRVVAWLAGAGLVVAWLAAAADRQPTATGTSGAGADAAALAHAERLAEQIQAQATRLHAHLAAAPRPTESERDPFRFDPRADRGSRANRADAEPVGSALAEALASGAPEPPPLTLSGIAEEPAAENSAAPVRTAVLSGYGDVFLAKVGETVASRYRVTAIGADAVELEDQFTGRTIRLGLR